MTTLAQQVEGLRSVTGSTERDVVFPTPAFGQKVYNRSSFMVEEHDGTAWRPILGSAEIFNVKRYGAVGDGVTDDTVAIQAALTAACAAHGTCFLPAGQYLITATLAATDNTREWVFEGVGSGFDFQSTAIIWGGALNGTMFSMKGCKWVHLNHVSFDGSNTAGVGVLYRNGPAHEGASDLFTRHLLGINMKGSPGVVLYLGEGDDTPGLYDIDLYEFQAWDSVEGIRINNGGCQTIRMWGGSLIGCSAYGVHFMKGGWLDAFNIVGINNAKHFYMPGGFRLNCHGGYFEAGTILHWGNHGPGHGVTFIGCNSTEGTLPLFIYDGGAVPFTFLNNYFVRGIDISPTSGLFSQGDTFLSAAWVTSTAYTIGKLVTVSGVTYYCTSSHTSAALTQPGVGANWATVWNAQTASSGWLRNAFTTIMSFGQLLMGATFSMNNTGGMLRISGPGAVSITGATPSIANGFYFELSQSGATNVTDFTGGQESQQIIIRSADGNSTLKHNSSFMRLKGAVDAVMATDRTITLIRGGGNVWYEIARNF